MPVGPHPPAMPAQLAAPFCRGPSLTLCALVTSHGAGRSCSCRVGSVDGPEAQQVAATYALPSNRDTSGDDKKRHAIIYADALRKTLRKPGGR